MHKPAAASVDADMVDASSAARGDPEKYQVPGSQFLQSNGSGRAILIAGRPRDIEANRLMRINGKPAAIKAMLVGAAKFIGRAYQPHRCLRDCGALLVLRLRSRRQPRRTAAGCDEQDHRSANGDAQTFPFMHAARATPSAKALADVAHVADFPISHCAGLQQLCHHVCGERPGEVEPLCNVAATLAQEIQLLDSLDALCHYALAERV